MSRDEMVDLVMRVREEHMLTSAASPQARGGEHWSCRCGVGYRGEGALAKGHRHTSSEVVAALDAAGVIA